MYKKNGRTAYKSNRRPSFKKTGGYKNFNNRNRGNVSQQYNKYLKLAKLKITRELFNTYDNYIKKRYKIDINYQALDNVKNYFN